MSRKKTTISISERIINLLVELTNYYEDDTSHVIERCIENQYNIINAKKRNQKESDEEFQKRWFKGE